VTVAKTYLERDTEADPQQAFVALPGGGIDYVQDDDPGAVGAKKTWLQTDPTGNILGLPLWVRSGADDEWLAAGVHDIVETVENEGRIYWSAYTSDGSIGSYIFLQSAGGVSQGVVLNVYNATGSAAVILAADGLHIGGTTTTPLIQQGAADPNTAPVGGPDGSLYLRTDGTQWTSVSGTWVQNFAVPAPLPELPAIPIAQDIADALVALGLVTQAAP
jgi:hypothetical protein